MRVYNIRRRVRCVYNEERRPSRYIMKKGSQRGYIIRKEGQETI